LPNGLAGNPKEFSKKTLGEEKKQRTQLCFVECEANRKDFLYEISMAKEIC